MKTVLPTLFAALMLSAPPAFAQDAPPQTDAEREAAHATHGYTPPPAAAQGLMKERAARTESRQTLESVETDELSGPAQDRFDMASPTSVLTLPPLSEDKAVLAAMEAGGQPVVFFALGVDCSICAAVLTKRLTKHRHIAATHVDDRSRAVTVVIQPEKVLADIHIEKLVRKAGYKVDTIWRPEIVPQG